MDRIAIACLHRGRVARAIPVGLMICRGVELRLGSCCVWIMIFVFTRVFRNGRGSSSSSGISHSWLQYEH